VFSKMPAYVNGVSEELFKKGICLPSGSNLSLQDLERVEKIIRKLYGNRD